MKNILVVALLMLVIFASVAVASDYTVVAGDTLSGIASKKLGGVRFTKELAEINNLSSPDLIYPGQVLIIPDGTIVRKSPSQASKVHAPKSGTMENPKNYADSGVGAAPFKGTALKGLTLLGLMVKGEKLLSIELLEGDAGFSEIENGDLIFMVSDISKVFFYKVALSPGRKLMTRVYRAEILDKNGLVRTVLVELNPWCGNWLIKVVEVIPPQEEITVGTPPELTGVPVPFEETYVELFPEPEPYQPEEQICPDCPIEHEPIVGAGTWINGIARGNFAYAEYMLWLKQPLLDCDSEYSWGLGAYGSWEDGKSRLSDYKWRGDAVGVQIGLKRYWFYRDEEDKKSRPQQWVAKLRLVVEETNGKNPASGYRMHQDNLKLGGYAEYVRELDDKWQGIITAEGWMGLDESIKSTWSGDSPAKRGTAAVGAYAQYQINNDWATRVGGKLFWQQWDDMYGIHASAELRWKDTLMFGPFVNLFPFGKSDIYNGIPLSDLQTVGAFARAELGVPIRNYDRKVRGERIKADDEARFSVQ